MRVYTRETAPRLQPTLARLTLIARALREENAALMESRHVFSAEVATRAMAAGYAAPAETDLRAAVTAIYATRNLR